MRDIVVSGAEGEHSSLVVFGVIGKREDQNPLSYLVGGSSRGKERKRFYLYNYHSILSCYFYYDIMF